MNAKALIAGLLFIIFFIFYLSANSQTKEYCFDSIEVKGIRLVFEEKDFLKTFSDSLNSRCSLYKKNISSLNDIIEMQDTIISHKEIQIRKLEAIPQTIIQENKTGFFVFAGIVVSCVAVGLIGGILIK